MSVIKLDFNNIEDLVFLDSSLRQKLPEFKGYFDQWKLATMTGARSLKNKSLLYILNHLNNEQIKVIEHHLDDKITIDKSIDHRNIRLLSCNIDDAESELNKMDPKGYPSMYRKGGQLYICFWK